MLAGLPDLVGVINGRFFGIEVKMPGENPTVRQMHIHRRIRESGGSVTVARSVPDALAFIRRVIARSHTQERVTSDLKASR